MMNIVDFELELRGTNGSYIAEIRIDQGMDSFRRYAPFPVAIDRVRLLSLSDSSDAYGSALTEMLFDAPGIREVFAFARWLRSRARTILGNMVFR